MIPKFLRRRPTPADLPPVTVPPRPVPVPVPTVPRGQADFTPAPPTVPLAGPGPVFQPGRYVVQYSRTIGPVAVAPLTVIADSAADLAEQIRRDLEPWLGQRIEITLDTTVSGGTIRAAQVRGAFTYTRGGAR